MWRESMETRCSSTPSATPTTIAIAVHRFEQFQTMRQEAADLWQALADSKVIERAKGILMKKGKLDEPEAFAGYRNSLPTKIRSSSRSHLCL